MFAFKSLIALATMAASVSANCIHATSFHRREVSEEGTVEVSKFGYSDLQGPLNWAGLDAANSACATSKVQSPIVIDDSIPKASEAPVLDFPSVEEAEFENLGTTLETIVSGTTKFAGKEFSLKQFHLHTPSEHRIREEYFPMEMHMVHEAEDGSIAVIAIPFQLSEDGSTTELLTSVISNIENVREPGKVTKTGPLDFATLVEAVQKGPLFQYTGSLTTPPCAEGLTFLVLEEPLPLNVKTFNTIKSVIKFNARYTQNKLENTNLIQIAAQKAELSCAAVEGAEVSGSAAVELMKGDVGAKEEMKEEVKVEEVKVKEEEKPMAHESMPQDASTTKPMEEKTSSETSTSHELMPTDEAGKAAYMMKVAASEHMSSKKMMRRRRLSI